MSRTENGIRRRAFYRRDCGRRPFSSTGFLARMGFTTADVGRVEVSETVRVGPRCLVAPSRPG